MNIMFTSSAWEDYLYWNETNKDIIKKIHEILKSISRTPFQGVGKPEPLKQNLKGYWSRRITQEHRLVYFISDGLNDSKICTIIQCRYHY